MSTVTEIVTPTKERRRPDPPHDWGPRAREPAAAATLHELFTARAAAVPEAIALEAGDERLTYRELERRAADLARRLRRQGVGPEVVVGVCLPRRAELIVALLAILEAGGAYLPLDPRYPRERLAFLLDDAAVPLVLTRGELLPSLPEHPARFLCLDAPGAAAGEGAGGATGAAGHLAYLIYTSGSTGRPKGVAIEHASAVALVAWARQTFAPAALARMLASTSVNFDLSVFEIFVPLASGATVVLADDALALRELPSASRISFVNTVPSALAELLRGRGLPAGVRAVGLAGEPLPQRLAEALYAQAPAVELYNLYGPSEDTTYSTWSRVGPGTGKPLIGRPLRGTWAYIVDRRLEPVPAAVEGELYLGGAGLARGYLGRPALTAERFVPDPFSGVAGGRLYRTGDLVRQLAGGELDFLGRLDHQIKLRGFRIELGEVEAVIAAHPGVREVVVMARELPSGDPGLVAYVVPEGPSPGAGELRCHVARRLPDYMTPTAFVDLKAMPRTPNGKVDRTALGREPLPAAVAGARPALSVAYEPPQGPAEERLAAIFEELLRVAPVGRDDDFFELGGHSLMAARALWRVEQDLGVSPSRHALFAAPTVRDLAAELTSAATPPALPVLCATGRVALSFYQEEMWFFEQLMPGTALYNMPFVGHLRGPVRVAELAAALNAVVGRHHVLRTRFVDADGRPAAGLIESLVVGLPVVDLRGLAPDRGRDEAWRQASLDARRPFDLRQVPLLRASIVRVEAEESFLLLSLHHIVCDDWSMEVLVRELGEIYRARLRGEPSPLPELKIQYGDFAAWQRQWLAGEALEPYLRYVRRELGDAPQMLELPADRPRPSVRDLRGAWHRFALPASLQSSLGELARGERSTLYVVLLAVFAALIHRYTGRRDFLLGSPGANRGRPEAAGLIGLFASILTVRVNLAGEPTFRSLLARVREKALAAIEHQELPFEQVLRELRLTRSVSHNPLVQVFFALQNTPPFADRLAAGVTQQFVELGTGHARADLALYFWDRGSDLAGVAEYRWDLFDRTTIERLTDHFRRLAEAVAAAPDERLTTLPLLGAAELQQLLIEWNDVAGEAPAAAFQERLAARARRRPDAVALVAGERVVTYGELDRRANRLACFLRGLGVGPESRVAFCLRRSPAVVETILGILKAGGAFVPLDRSYPDERLVFILADSAASVLVTHSDLLRRLHDAGGMTALRVVCVDRDGAAIARQSAADPAVAVAPQHLAYAIYTSGSTGRPKGVLLDHAGLSNLATASVRGFEAAAGERALLFAPLAFDTAVFEIVTALHAGAALVLLPRDELMPGPILGRRLAERRITRLTMTPSALAVLPETVGTAVQAITVAGEACPGDLVDRWAPSRRFFNGYGPTEVTVWGARARCHAGAGRPPIGRPALNKRLYVVDRRLRAVPMGVPGELVIAGVGVARGYLGRPAATAASFLPEPIGGACGARMYRTGDRVRWRRDGELEFLGRIDDQVKIRGFRVEPGEAESVLARYPGLREAAVVAREDRRGEPRLVAYVVWCRDAAVSELRAFLGEHLPDYMVPSTIVALAALPRTPNDKVDRPALARRPLPVPESDRESLSAAYAAPRNPAEEVLAAIWADLLGGGRVGVDDDFFELGGHSLLATRVISRLRRAFGVELPVQALFEAPTVAGLAARAVRQGRAAATPPIRPADRAAAPPLSFAQQRLWFLYRFDPGSTAYNVSVALWLDGPLAPGLLARGLSVIVRRHESLRTHFAETGGEPCQVVEPPRAWALPVVDLSRLATATSREQARRLAGAQARQAFDLTRGPLLRSTLLRLAAAEHLLALTFHHAIADGASVGILLRELTTLYRAFLAGESAGAAARRLPELPIRYADFTVWQRAGLSGEVLAEQIAYWRRRLGADPPPLELPADRPRPAVRSLRGALWQGSWPAPLSAGLKELARRLDATLFMLLLAGFKAWLARVTGRWNPVVGTPVAARTRAETEHLIGFFANTLALATPLAPGLAFDGAVARVREGVLGALAHQDVPFEKLVEELVTQRDLGTSPLFQVAFSFQAEAVVPAELAPGLAVRFVPSHTGTSKFDLTLFVEESRDGLQAAVEYCVDLFDATTVQRMTRQLGTLLAASAVDPGLSLAALPLLAPADRQQLLAEWGVSAGEAPGQRFHELLAARARRLPDAVALVAGERGVTYGELDRQARRLGRRLRRHGVGPEVPVAICLERSPLAVAAILAALEAGGAFVPLDPSYPDERLAFMLADSAAPVLVTRGALVERLERLASAAALVCLDQELGSEPAVATAAVATAAAATAPENLAYAIYTSGSTGRPKGVMLGHAGLANLAEASVRAFGVAAGERALLFAPLAFDTAVFEIVTTLHAGATLVILPPAELMPGPLLTRRLAEHRVTRLTMTPSALAVLPEAELASVEAVTVAGEACPAELVERWAPGRRFFNGYGPTEVTVWGARARCRRGDGQPPIGRPALNKKLVVTDARLRPVPVATPGELAIGGVGVARGYLGRPAATAAAFVPDPFSGAGARLYRTGDRTRWRRDGELEFLGRIDEQVKIRGFRVEPGEVEAVLRVHPELREAAVVTRQDRRGEPQLVAYVVPRFRELWEAAGELRRWLAERLPDYLVPAAVVALEGLPRTPNDKVDRAALRRLPLPASQVPSAAYAAPRGPEQEVLAAIWADLLELERVGAEDDFFELGGHSLLATRVISRVRDVFAVELPLQALFEAPTVAGLAARVGRAQRAAAPPLERADRRQPLPLSFAQQRLWFLDRFEPGSAAYNLPAALGLEGELDAMALRRALTTIVERHEALRTRFVAGRDDAVQVIEPPRPGPLPVIDLTPLPPERRRAAAERLSAGEVARPFDLSRGPLIRFTLLRLGPAEHRLLLVLHHIVSDGWSMDVLLEELAVLYEAFARGTSAALPELAIQYADFAVWQRRWLAGEVLEAQLAYWRQRLGGEPAPLELPTDRPRPAVRTSAGATVATAIPRGLGAGLAALGRRHQASSFMVLLAAFQTLLSRYSGQTEILVGTPIANRNRLETERLIGFFVNTLALRSDLSGDPRFCDLLAHVRRVALEAYACQDVPFEKLVEEIAPQRDTGRTPFFQAVLAYQHEAPALRPAGRLRIEPLPLEGRTAKFDLTLALAEHQGTLAASLEYSRDLFERPTVQRLLEHFLVLLESVAGAPQSRLSELDLMTPRERHQVTTEWNDTRTAYPAGASIHGLFERWAERTPDSVALVGERAALTYRELDRRADRLSRRLAELGVTPEVAVAVALERHPDVVVALLAILKAGGAYVPLELAAPPERLAFILGETGAAVLLTRRDVAASVGGDGGVRKLELDTEAATLRRYENGPPGPRVAPQGLAYVMYTSGSTGRPKGVGVSHRNVVRLVRETSFADFGREQVFLHLAPLAFDASTFEIWGPLLNGGRLVLFPAAAPTLHALTTAIARHRITTLWLTAGLFHQLPADGLRGLTTLRQLLAGGDVLLPGQVREVLAALPGSKLINGYGPTEGTTFTTCCPLERPWEVGASVSIGRPIANTRVLVLDGHQRPVPLGVCGELHAGGDGVARGYHGRPALTAERFVPDPCGGPGARLYRTGDLARFLPAGRLDFLGRRDTQVKVRGFRVELEEIETLLAEHPGVAQAVVLAPERPDGGKRLVGVVVPGTAPGPAAGELRAFLRRRLADYMVPAAFVEVAELPLTPNGKVDRGALDRLVPTLAGAERQDVQVAPRTPLEAQLTAIWAEVLGVERLGVHDNFFELGGHSLMAIRIAARLHERLGVDLPLRTLFRSPTVAALAAALAPGAAGEGIVRQRRGEAPLSYAQQRLWFLDRLDTGSAAYNVGAVFALRGPLEAPALAQAIEAIVRRHETLRTRFAGGDGEPRQVIDPPRRRKLPRVDLSGLPPAVAAAAARELARHEARRPFDLERGPLLRDVLLRLAPAEHRLFFTVHHIVADGWSIDVLERELAALYDARRRGASAAGLPELPIQYADFALWQRDRRNDEKLAAQLAYWRRRLGDDPAPLELPTDRPRPAVQGLRGSQHRRRLPRALAAALRGLARSREVTSFTVLAAGFMTLLARWTGERRLVVGTPVAGRGRSETEHLIGFFVNTLVLSARLEPAAGFGAAVGRVREAVLGALEHQDLPFERLVNELRPGRDLSTTPLFQVFFALAHEAPPVELAPGLVLTREDNANDTTKFDFSLFVHQGGDALVATAEYDVDLFDATTVMRVVEQFETVLAAAVAEPERALGEIVLLTAAQRHQVQVEWNDTAGEAVAAGTLHGLFGRRAAASPDAVALVAGDQRLSFRELDRRAEALARRLRRLGVGPEVPVGVCLPRDGELVTALLGILKAGGAYLSLDPDYPAERLAFLLADSGAPLVLTRTDLAATVDQGGVMIRSLDALPPLAGEAERPRPAGTAGGDSLAYLIYTSGSTGRPKGVAIEHRSAAVLVAWARRTFSESELARMLASTSTNFDLSVFEIFVPLAGGGTVVLAADALALPELPEAAVSFVNTVPSALAELLRGPGLPASVRAVGLAGEPLPRPLADAVFARTAAERLFNLYGPSEDTTYSTWARIERGDPGKPLIGRPVAGTRAHLLDRGGRPVPLAAPGELHLGGAGLARGYLGRPARTASSFVPDPFAREAPGGRPGARLYRTGDLARWRPHGEMEFLGRIDHQIKLRGFRIELGEIETVLARHPEVREAVVTVRARTDDRQLVGYVVAAGDRAPSAGELQTFLRFRLPDHMVPAVFVPLGSLPLTPNGKVDRRALPEPGEGRDGAGGFVAPRSPLEERLAAIWSQVLGVDRVGVHDNFFALGGHSLLAVRAAVRVRQATGREVPLRAFFQAPTVAELAAVAGELAVAEEASIPRRDRTAPLPVSFAQQRLWLVDRLDPGSTAFNLPWAARLAGPLDVAALQAALAALVRRHEPLRTTFAVRDGAPVEVVAADAPAPLPVVDLGGLPASLRAALAELLRARFLRPFDLGRGPLWRAALLRLGPREHHLLFDHHHIVTDGWSLSVLCGDLAALYGELAGEGAAALPELPIQYADYAAWQRGQLTGERLASQLAYWRQQLGGTLPILELPTDRPRPAVRRYRGGHAARALPAVPARALRRLSQRHGASLFMTLLAAFGVLLSRLAGEDDLIVGTPIAGRPRLELERLLGIFLNNLALRLELAGNPRFEELLTRVKGTVLGAFEHQDVPFEKLLEELQPERHLSRTPVFQVFFNMTNLPETRLEMACLEVDFLAAPEAESKFDLTLYIAESDAGIRFNLVYDADIFAAPRAEILLEQYAGLLEQVAADATVPIGELDLVTASTRARLPDPREELDAAWLGAVHELFRERAARHGERPAVVDPRGVRTYRWLEERSNRVAHWLLAHGLGKGRPVAIFAHRSAPLVEAVLGTLKAGGAFLLLEPAYPALRLAEMVRRAAPAAWIGVAAAGAPPGAVDELLDELACPRLELGPERDDALDAQPATPPAVAVGTDDAALVAFTSGSTGVPKGIVGRHGPLSHFLPFQRQRFDLRPEERYSLLSGLAHDPLQRDLFTPLALGGTVVIPAADRFLDPGYLADWLRRQKVNVAHLTPALGQLLTQGAEGRTASALRYVLLVGDVLTPRDVHRLRELAPGVTVVNLYGSTETQRAVGFYEVAAAPIDPDAAASAQALPLGRGMRDVQLLVLNAAGRLAGVGELGEICVRSPHLARGYLKAEELTRQRFVRNPFGDREDDRLYRTGDLGRYLPDGNAVFAGRADRQVKIRGFRIELGDVEAQLGELPGVERAVVVVRAGADGQARLVAYVVGSAGAPPAGDLRARLAERLPDHMLPAAFVALAAFPLTPNGKIDRAALPEPESTSSTDAGYVAPRNAVEEELAAIWSKWLEVARVGVHDHFFQLGGHSLLATQVVAEVHDRLGVELPVRSLFESPTLEQMALAVVEAQASGIDENALGGILEKLEGLSEEELDALLADDREWIDAEDADV